MTPDPAAQQESAAGLRGWFPEVAHEAALRFSGTVIARRAWRILLAALCVYGATSAIWGTVPGWFTAALAAAAELLFAAWVVFPVAAAVAIRSPWRQARTLADVGDLTADWLTGELDRHPLQWGPGGPDEETNDLIPTLALLNRSGFVTDGSQPGETCVDHEGWEWRQRAAVTGWCDTATLSRLVSAADRAGLMVRTPVDDPTPVTARWPIDLHPEPAEVVCTWFGEPPQVHRWFPTRAADALAAATYITVIDPVWGRNDVLWPALTAAVVTAQTDGQAELS